MGKIDLELLKNLILLNEYPILVENLPKNLFKNSVVLSNDCDVSLLNGHYEGINFVAPEWYNILIEKCKTNHTMLIINDINKSSINDQLKFVELLKYKKISTFKLPSNCSILITVDNLKDNPVAEEIYNLVAHI